MPDNTPGTPYKEIADRVLNKIKSFEFLEKTEDETYAIINLNMDSAISKFYSCKQDLDDRADDYFNVNLTSMEKEILSMLMVIEYMDSNYIRVPEKMQTYFSSKDINAGSAWQQLGQIEKIRAAYVRETERLISRYSYIGSKLFDVNTEEIP